MAWLSNIGCSVSGIQEEQRERIVRFPVFLPLRKAEKAASFPTSLNPRTSHKLLRSGKQRKEPSQK